jgi:hypothetical protein
MEILETGITEAFSPKPEQTDYRKAEFSLSCQIVIAEKRRFLWEMLRRSSALCVGTKACNSLKSRAFWGLNVRRGNA